MFLVWCFFVTSNVGYLHEIDFIVLSFPHGHVSGMPFLQVAMMAISSELTIIRPVTTDRTVSFYVQQKSKQALFDVKRKFPDLFLDPFL